MKSIGFILLFSLALSAQPMQQRYVVYLSEEARPERAAIAATYNAHLEDETPDGGFVMTMNPAHLRLLQSDHRVKRVVVPNGSGDMIWTYTYDGAGNVASAGNDTYAYDSVNRLLAANVDNANNTMSYTYDAYGNRTSATAGANAAKCVGGTDCDMALTINSSTNRIQNATYDVAGNVKVLPNGSTFVYDATSMVTTDDTTNAQYVYTAENERIATYANTTWTWTIRDLANHPLREFTSADVTTANGVSYGTASLAWQRDYVYRGSQLLASEARLSPTSSSIMTEHFHLDHLGTPRLITNAGGGKLGYHSYYPFGGELDLNPFETPEARSKFTGHIRDTGRTGGISLDYMHARSYSATVGRFLSIDPTWHSADPGKPQSWNRYSYVLNNPVLHTDPDGRCSPAVIDCVIEGFEVAGPSGGLAGLAIGLGLFTGGAYAGAGSNSSVGDSPALDRHAQNVSNHLAEKLNSSTKPLPKPPTGKGSVEPPARDPKRKFTPKERETKRDAQGGQCANGCGKTSINRILTVTT